MSLRDQITSELKTAMKDRNADKLECLRFLQAQIKNKEIDIRPNVLSDDEILQVIGKLVKQRKEGIEQFQSAGRQDLVEKEERELAILESFLPEQMGESEVKAVIDGVVKDLGASSMKDMGAVMKEVLNKTQGAADGKLVSQLVKASLQN